MKARQKGINKIDKYTNNDVKSKILEYLPI